LWRGEVGWVIWVSPWPTPSRWASKPGHNRHPATPFSNCWRFPMISVVLMAALMTAPEANANLFNRHSRHSAPACCGAPAPCNDCAAPAPCSGCGDAAPATTTPPVTGDKDKGQSTPPAPMPKGDKDKVETKVETKVEEKKTVIEEKKTTVVEKKEAPIEIPAA